MEIFRICMQKGLNKAARLNPRFCEGKEDLQRIGQVLHVSSSRNMILKAENVPRIGNKVLDENLKPVGIIFDVFGPTSSPYVAVKPSIHNPQDLVKRILYAVPSKFGNKKRKKRR
jgi:RNA-binding protein